MTRYFNRRTLGLWILVAGCGAFTAYLGPRLIPLMTIAGLGLALWWVDDVRRCLAAECKLKTDALRFEAGRRRQWQRRAQEAEARLPTKPPTAAEIVARAGKVN